MQRDDYLSDDDEEESYRPIDEYSVNSCDIANQIDDEDEAPFETG